AKEKEGGKARETAVAQRGAASCESGPAFSPRAPQHRPLMPPALDGPATFRGRLAMSDCQEPKGPSKKPSGPPWVPENERRAAAGPQSGGGGGGAVERTLSWTPPPPPPPP
ncbi:unnamed protein product, partial [Prorocentrum cordatum]